MALLLRDGAVIGSPTRPALGCANALEELGVIAIRRRTVVLCSNPIDRDYPWAPTGCPGRIELDGSLSENDGDYRCPRCDRVVYPLRARKATSNEVIIRIRQEGVEAFIQSLLEVGEWRCIRETEGVYRVEVEADIVYVCIADLCPEHPYLASDWARQHRVCYVTVHPEAPSLRLLDEPWICSVGLVDLISGTATLDNAVAEAAQQSLANRIVDASAAVYARGVPPVRHPQAAAPPPQPRLVVSIQNDQVLINDVQLFKPQAKALRHVFMVLWRHYLRAGAAGSGADKHEPMTLKQLADSLRGTPVKVPGDDAQLRRTVNRLQEHIASVLAKNGLVVNREDVIETVRWSGQDQPHGYRLNARRVVPQAM